MAKPNPKAPSKTVKIFCSKCQTQLYKYQKGGKGALIKAFKQRIVKDFTHTPCTCQNCQNVFARETLIRGTPAFKFIGDRVWCK